MGNTVNSGPEIVDAVSGWAKIRGVLGALLGGFAVSFALLELLFSGPDQMRGYGILLGLFNSFGAAFGYWLFRGPRDRRFASRTVYFTTALTPFLAVPVRLILYALRLMGWPPAASPDFLQCVYAGVRAALAKRSILLALVHMLFGLLCANMGAGLLLRYADGVYWHSPQRLAAQRAGGLMYNYWPEGGPDWQPLPPSFQVGPIRVTGDTIQVTPSLRKGKSFTVWDAKSLIIGPSSGSCVICGFQDQVLAKFGMANKSAAMLVQLLLESGVPFYDCFGEPVPAPRTAKPADADGVTFSVIMRTTTLAGGVMALCLIASLVLAFMAMYIASRGGVDLTWAIFTFPLAGLLIGGIPMAAAGQLFPGLLVVEKGRLYRQSIWTKKRRELTNLDALRVSNLDKAYVLYDKDEVILATFSPATPHADQLLAYLAERHHITPSGPPEKERK